MSRCESRTVKKAGQQRIDAFALWCWRRLLRVPWAARRSNQSILKELSHDRSLARLMLKLKLQYFSHLMRRVDSLEKTLMLGKIEGRRRRGWQRMRWLDGITNSWTWVWASSRSWWWTGKPGVLQSMELWRVGHDWETELTCVVKNPPANSGDTRYRFNPWLGRSRRGGNGNPLHYSCLENHMDRGAWWAIVHQVTKSWTGLSN